MEYEKIKQFFSALIYVIGAMTFKQKIVILASFAAGLSMVYAVFISPIFFNYIIIPNIEKKVKKKIEL